jgi:tetratricopeptide (TPR) repeat protein
MFCRSAILLFTCVILAGFSGARASAANVSTEFDAANKLYEQGKFRDATAAYQAIARTGTVSAALDFNLGNAFYKCGEIGRALASYRQAERLDPRDPDLRANVQFVLNRVQGPTLTPSRWQAWLQRLTLNEWTELAAAAVWLWLVLLVARQLRPAWKPALRTLTLLSGVAAAVLCFCLGARFLARSEHKAIVIAQEATVRNGPLEESKPAYTVHDGAELSVLDKKDDWLQVDVGGRRIGWLKRGEVLLWPGGA